MKKSIIKINIGVLLFSLLCAHIALARAVYSPTIEPKKTQEHLPMYMFIRNLKVDFPA